ncbi:type VI secretion system baseplate subunit TssK [Desulfonema ishimotonii]|uniref:Type VI secretion system baseplate subunit TssK n=1 Tax=Desulfonema ishimotonii TaxID=45657 RepID=A0A401FYX6_9BACT|nr:type VI secretion system baseplate subunit TssK [Desulfonema ishimotonii]GBC62150.1 type VI secretion system baseplate subunit TssK [Desulfonema ishimotonii]
MADAHHLPPAIHWHEGMLLAPQHFQQLSGRHEALLHYHLTATAPFHWGVRKLEIDTSLLRVNGIFRVVRLEAVVPDGTVICHLPDAESLETDLNPYIPDVMENQKLLTVHLAVPVRRPGTAPVRGEIERFRAVEGEPVPDESTGDTAVAIPRLHPRISLLVTDEPSPRYSAFPLMRVRYENEKFDRTDFIPPRLTAASDSEITVLCREVADLLRRKAEILAEKLQADAMNLETRFSIHSLVSGLPGFEAILGTGCAHPFLLYLSLCSLAGNVTVVGSDPIPPRFSTPYDHNDLRATFEYARQYIFRMIEEGIFESYDVIPFDFSPENRIFALDLKPEWTADEKLTWAEDHLVIGVKGRSGMTGPEVREWMGQSLIGSASKIDSLRERKILGASRTEMREDKTLVPPKDVLLFTVAADPRFVLPGEALQIRNLGESDAEHVPLEIALYLRRKVRQPAPGETP